MAGADSPLHSAASTSKGTGPRPSTFTGERPLSQLRSTLPDPGPLRIASVGLLEPDQEGQREKRGGSSGEGELAQSTTEVCVAGQSRSLQGARIFLACSRTSEQQELTTCAYMGLPGKEMKARSRMSTSPKLSKPVFSSAK